MDCSLPGSSVHVTLQARILEWFAIPFSRDLPDPGIEPESPALQADFLHLSHQEVHHIYQGLTRCQVFSLISLNPDNYEADSFSPWRRGGPGNPPQRSCLEKAHHRPSLLFSPSVLSLCDPMDCSIPAVPVLHHLLEFAQNHVH